MTQMAQEPTETVREIWDLRHKEDPERVGAMISAAEFQEMRARIARQCVPFTEAPDWRADWPSVLLLQPNFHIQSATWRGSVHCLGVQLPQADRGQADDLPLHACRRVPSVTTHLHSSARSQLLE